MGTMPVLNIADPELIKLILVKDFHLFTDRTKVWISPDNIMSKNLPQLHGDQWRRVRSIVSPLFTSGKLRRFEPKIKDCLDNFTKHIDNLLMSNKSINVDALELFNIFTLDVIARCAFGIEINIYGQSENNLFVENAQKKFIFSGYREFMTIMLPRSLHRLLGMSNTDTNDYFVNIIRNVISKRRQNPDERHDDFIQLFLEARLIDELDKGQCLYFINK